MYRAIPTANKLLFKKEKESLFSQHQQRLKQIQAHIDTSSPDCYDQLTTFNKKKLQIMEDRYTEIERENRILLEKITGIMKQNPKTVTAKQPVGIELPIQNTKKSLNVGQRKQQLVKITIENQNLLKRLKDKKSTYSVKTQLKDWKVHQKLKQNIQEYPENKIRSMSQYPKNNLSGVEESNYQSGDNDLVTRQLTSNGAKRATSQKLDPFNSTSGNNNSSQIKEKKTLYKKSKKFGLSYYIIEVSISKGIFRITAEDVEKPTTRVLEMYEKDGMLILNNFFEKSIEKLVDSLIINDKITIRGIDQYLETEVIPDKKLLNSSQNQTTQEQQPMEAIQEDMKESITNSKVMERELSPHSIKSNEKSPSQPNPKQQIFEPLKEEDNYEEEFYEEDNEKQE